MMQQYQEQESNESSQQGSLFDRVMPAVEMHPTDRLLEIVSAIILSLATVTSAWCAYEAARWNGNQALYFNEAGVLGREATRLSLVAEQRMLTDVALFMEFTSAKFKNNEEYARFLLERFPGHLRKVTDDWLAMKPLQNPMAPLSPLDMQGYSLSQEIKAEKIRQQAQAVLQQAKTSNLISDRYILLMVIFASVLFFAGVGTKFQSRRLKSVILTIGGVVYLIGASVLLTFPVH